MGFTGNYEIELVIFRSFCFCFFLLIYIWREVRSSKYSIHDRIVLTCIFRIDIDFYLLFFSFFLFFLLLCNQQTSIELNWVLKQFQKIAQCSHKLYYLDHFLFRIVLIGALLKYFIQIHKHYVSTAQRVFESFFSVMLCLSEYARSKMNIICTSIILYIFVFLFSVPYVMGINRSMCTF